MENFVCAHCNFKFRAKKVEKCPWCNRLDGIEREKSAEDLLNEVEGLIE